jgi:hypothetical protein
MFNTKFLGVLRCIRMVSCRADADMACIPVWIPGESHLAWLAYVKHQKVLHDAAVP